MPETEPTLQTFHNVANDVGGTVYEGYSGRGMYGKRCIGISCDSVAACVEAAAVHGLRGAHWDNLGKGWIVYWPQHNPKGET